MEKKAIYILVISVSILLSHCSRKVYEKGKPADVTQEQPGVQEDPSTHEENKRQNEIINAANKKAWEEARKVQALITDSDFLQTKRPMCDDAIAPYNYHTGYVEDRAYNQTIYILALERAKKHLTLQNDKLVLTIKSGSEINIAEDLYQFIVMVIDSWDEYIKQGMFRIVKTKDGYYDIEPTR